MTRNFLRRYLSGKLTPDELGELVKSFDVVGDIAIVKVPSKLERRKQIIAEAILAGHGNVRTVLNQISSVSGDYRLRGLEWIAGEEKTETVYLENRCIFKVDLSNVYFSPRLSFERMRVGKLVKEGETVLNMFAGVGCFSIIIARHCKAERIYSIDVNPRAIELMKETIAMNKVGDRVEAILGDAKEVVEGRFRGVANRILMPLPEKAYEYLDVACQALKPEGGCVHYYDFVHSKQKEEAMDMTYEKVKIRLTQLQKKFDVTFSRVVRTVGPNWSQVVLDITVL